MRMRLIDADECLAFLKENCSKDMYLAVRAILDPCKTVNAVVIPENTTNGDMIKTLFPLVEVRREISSTFDNIVVRDDLFFGAINRFHADWWKAPYKRGDENE